jgi:hypothetical protein
MSAKHKFWRALCFVLATLAAIAAGHYGMSAAKRSAWLKSGRAAEPVRIQADLSRVSDYRTRLRNTHDFGHGMGLFVTKAGGFQSETDARQALAGLKGHFVVRSSEGEVLNRTDFDGDQAQVYRARELEGLALVGSIHIAPQGEFLVHATVTQPARLPDAGGHWLVGRYIWCGLEVWPMYISIGIAAVLAVLALCFGLLVGHLGHKAGQPLLMARNEAAIEARRE